MSRSPLAYLQVIAALVFGLWTVLFSVPTVLDAQEQAPPAEAPTAPATPPPPLSPAIQAMLGGLLSEETPRHVRLGNAHAMLLDPQSHAALVGVLSGSGNETAKQIICEAIANGANQLDALGKEASIPPVFIDPLFSVLLDGDRNLSIWAARALANCRDGVAKRLAGIVNNAQETPAHRQASIVGLSLMPGSEPVKALANLLADPDPTLQAQAAKAIADMLALDQPISAKQYQEHYQPLLEKMSEADFLTWQWSQWKRRVMDSQSSVHHWRQQADSWRQQCFNAWSRELDNLEPKLRLDRLTKLAEPDDAAIRIWALEFLVQWQQAAPAQLDQLAPQVSAFVRPFISNTQQHLRQLSATILAFLGDSAEPAAEDLLKQLQQEKDQSCRAAQIRALGGFEYVPALDVAIQLIGAPEQEVAEEATRAVGRILGSAQAPEYQPEQLQPLAKTLSEAYSQSKVVAVKRELIQTMRRIAEQPRYKAHVADQFKDVFQAGLSDKDGALRRAAVEAVTGLYQAEALPAIKAAELLNDEDTRVRFAVTETMRQHGGKAELDQIYARLTQEGDGEVAQALRLALREILGRLTTADLYGWVQRLKDAPPREQPLRQEVLRLFSEKIAQDKSANRAVPAEYEIESYGQYAALAEQEKQFAQAIGWYFKQWQLLPADQRAPLSVRLLDLAATHDSNNNLLTMVQPVIDAQPQAALQQITALMDKHAADPVRAGRVWAAWVMPVKTFPTPELAQTWQQRRWLLAQQLITSQQKRLQAEDGRADPQAITLLTQLHPELKGYPGPEAPLEKRRQVLQQFENIIKQAMVPPPKPAAQAPAPAAQPVAQTPPAPPAQPAAATPSPTPQPAAAPPANQTADKK